MHKGCFGCRTSPSRLYTCIRSDELQEARYARDFCNESPNGGALVLALEHFQQIAVVRGFVSSCGFLFHVIERQNSPPRRLKLEIFGMIKLVRESGIWACWGLKVPLLGVPSARCALCQKRFAKMGAPARQMPRGVLHSIETRNGGPGRCHSRHGR